MIALFEERRGRLYGFRWRDRLDHSSAAPDAALAPTDQVIGTGDGTMATFAQCKTFELSRLASAYARNSSPLPSRARRALITGSAVIKSMAASRMLSKGWRAQLGLGGVRPRAPGRRGDRPLGN